MWIHVYCLRKETCNWRHPMHLRHPVTRAHSSVHQCAPLNAPHMYPALKPIYLYIYMYRPKYAPHIRIALKPIYTYICRRTCKLRHPMHLGHPVACAHFLFLFNLALEGPVWGPLFATHYKTVRITITVLIWERLYTHTCRNMCIHVGPWALDKGRHVLQCVAVCCSVLQCVAVCTYRPSLHNV